MLTLDGSHLEGGGQLVRTALALSTLTGKPFEVINIRKGREQPGLKAQHLHCITALQELCNAKAEGAALASSTLKFIPGKISGKTISIDIGTAGSISLLLQALLLPALFADKKVRFRITGGTVGKWAMPFEYFDNVFLPRIRNFSESIEAKCLRRGYYPAGGGKVDITIKPKYKISDFRNFEEFYAHLKQALPKINLTERKELLRIKGISHAANQLQKAEVAERQAKAAKLILSKFNCPVQISVEYSNTISTGSGITLWATFADGENPIILGSDALGEIGKRAEIVGQEAAQELAKEINSGAPVDRHLADNLIPFLIFGGKIKASEITKHCRTNIWVCEQFLGKIFKIDEENKIISCD